MNPKRTGIKGGAEGPIPFAISPMLAGTSRPFDSPDHFFEVKWDGIRCVVFLGVDGRPVHLQSRNLLDLDPHYPDLMGLGGQVDGLPCVLDGEIIAMREGRPSFLELQKRMNASGRALSRVMDEIPAYFVAFDMLYERGENLMAQPLTMRRVRLEQAVSAGGRMVLSQAISGTGKAFYEAACIQKLEGIMAKRRDSLYLPGKRSADWLKIKRTRLQPFAICGFYGNVSSRGVVSSLVIGAVHEGMLRGFGFVGSGFNERDLSLLARELPKIETAGPPGPDFPTGGRLVRWVRPVLVGLVEYLELTRARTLRHPVFRGFCSEMRPDDCQFDEEGLFDPDRRCGE